MFIIHDDYNHESAVFENLDELLSMFKENILTDDEFYEVLSMGRKEIDTSSWPSDILEDTESDEYKKAFREFQDYVIDDLKSQIEVYEEAYYPGHHIRTINNCNQIYGEE